MIYLLIVFVMTPSTFRTEYDAVTVGKYVSYEACEEAGKRSTEYGSSKHTCIPVVLKGQINEASQ